METNASSSGPDRPFDVDSSVRSVSFSTESSAQRLFETSYSGSNLNSTDRTGGLLKGMASFSELFKENSQPKEQSREPDRSMARSSSALAFSSGDSEPAAVSAYLNKYQRGPQERTTTDDNPAPVAPVQPDVNPGPQPGPDGSPGPGRPWRPRPHRPDFNPDYQPDNQPDYRPEVRPVNPQNQDGPGKIDDINPPKPPEPAPVAPQPPPRPRPRPCPGGG